MSDAEGKFTAETAVLQVAAPFPMASQPTLWNKARRPSNVRKIANDRPITTARYNLAYGLATFFLVNKALQCPSEFLANSETHAT